MKLYAQYTSTSLSFIMRKWENIMRNLREIMTDKWEKDLCWRHFSNVMQNHRYNTFPLGYPPLSFVYLILHVTQEKLKKCR